MRERRDRLRLALEPGERVGIGRDGLRKYLDRDVPVELPIPSPVDLPHSARAERCEDLVRPETGPGGECHGKTQGFYRGIETSYDADLSDARGTHAGATCSAMSLGS